MERGAESSANRRRTAGRNNNNSLDDNSTQRKEGKASEEGLESTAECSENFRGVKSRDVLDCPDDDGGAGG